METPPDDPAEHAIDFGRRYAQELDYHVAQRMIDLGIPEEKIGTPDAEHGIEHAAFHPDYGSGGGVAPDGRINLDSGVLNPELIAADAWAASRLRDRIDAIIAHEHEEARSGSHDFAVDHAPETALPIGEPARVLLRAIRDAEPGRGHRATPPGGSSPPR